MEGPERHRIQVLTQPLCIPDPYFHAFQCHFFPQGWWVSSKWCETCKWSLTEILPSSWAPSKWSSCFHLSKSRVGVGSLIIKAQGKEQHFEGGRKCFANSWLPMITRMRTLAPAAHEFTGSWTVHAGQSLRIIGYSPCIFQTRKQRTRESATRYVKSVAAMVSDSGARLFHMPASHSWNSHRQRLRQTFTHTPAFTQRHTWTRVLRLMCSLLYGWSFCLLQIWLVI